jgi:para-nitrobenzyl esterase
MSRGACYRGACEKNVMSATAKSTLAGLGWAALALGGCGNDSSAKAPADTNEARPPAATAPAGSTSENPPDASIPNPDATPIGPVPCGAVVRTKRGPIIGAVDEGACSFQGIPFAAPPSGSLRWKPPQPAATWSTPRPSKPGAACPQSASLFGDASTNEDCLYLNVWVPNPAPKGPAPVMVFVPGGGFNVGSGSWGPYDAAKLAAATGNVVVTVNYRLAALGFLSLPGLVAEDASAGNYGILDQIAAFQWVHDEIAAFGGDASKVTIFGESAGGTSMLVHLASPKSKGLFQRAIVESAWVHHDKQSALRRATVDAAGQAFAASMGCGLPSTQLACLRSVTVANILAYKTSYRWYPTVDGVVLPDDPMTLFATGAFNKVPTIIGTNRNEGTLFITQTIPPPVDPVTLTLFAESNFPGKGSTIAAAYPASDFGGSNDAAGAELLGDGYFVCPARRVARAIAASGTPVYRYNFAYAPTGVPVSSMGAFHGSELMFVFGRSVPFVALDTSEQPLSNLMMGYWGSMATTGAPNGGSAFPWPAYDTAENQIALGMSPSMESDYKKAKCDFWDALQF